MGKINGKNLLKYAIRNCIDLPKTREALRIWEIVRQEKKRKWLSIAQKMKVPSTDYGLGPPKQCKNNQGWSVLL